MQISEKEQGAILKRLKLAILKDRQENPNTYEDACDLSPYRSKAQQYEDEKALLMELINPDGSPAKLYPEFE